MIPKKKVSLKDIAKKVGVSAALVSYVLNGKEESGRVGKEKAGIIKRMAKEMNYQPNRLAQGLRSGKSFTIGLVIADISNPFFANIARVVENEARKHGYTVIYGSSDEDAAKSADLIEVLIGRQVDGFIIVSSENAEQQVYQLMERNIRFVLLDRHFPEINTDFVSTNNYKASFEAGNHLIEMGYSKIGMIAYQSGLYHMKERIRGYKDALHAKNLPFNNAWLQQVSMSNIKQEVQSAIDIMTSAEIAVDALIFATYSLAVNGLSYIKRTGLKVPSDVAIVSYGQAEVFDLYDCPISYILQDMELLGKTAVDILINKINNPKEAVKHILVDAKLVARESSGQKNMQKQFTSLNN